MRTVHWLFLVSIALFVWGVGFIVVAARSTRQVAPVDAPAMTPVASIRQIMNGIVEPAARAVWTSVGTTVTAAGIDERAPHTPREWAALGNNAAALVEAGNLLLVGGRAIDRAEWVAMSRALMDAGTLALEAAEGKNAEGIMVAGEKITVACDTCHQRYQRQ